MKKTLIVSLLCLSAIGAYAQSQNVEKTERQQIKERANAIYQQTHGNMGPGTEMHYKSNYSNVHAAYPDAPVNAIPAWPTSSDYTALEDPPCYKYRNNRGHEVMECPGARFAPESGVTTETAGTLNQESNGNFNVNREKTYTGYYPDLHAMYPDAPKNAVPAWPTSPYTELQNPPCYKYVNKRGLKVMECPGAQFEPEHEYR